MAHERAAGRSDLLRAESVNPSSTELTRKHCTSCEGSVAALDASQVSRLLAQTPAWKLATDGRRIRREWTVKDFATGLEFFRAWGELAESEGHHPDLHLSDYRRVAIELSTHAVGGLTENDFILAAKIDQLPVELKGTSR